MCNGQINYHYLLSIIKDIIEHEHILNERSITESVQFNCQTRPLNCCLVAVAVTAFQH